jgi:antitoxin CcdA
MSTVTTRNVQSTTSISVAADLLDRARALQVDISLASEEGLRRAVDRAQGAQWLEENGAALQSSNVHVERHGLPLAGFRHF